MSLTFDAFNLLSLPIPNQKNMSFTVKYIPCSLTERPLEFLISVGDIITVSEIRSKIIGYLQKYKEVGKDAEDEDSWIEPFLTSVTNKQGIEMIIDEKFINTHGLDKMGQEIIAYEREPLSIFNLEKDDDATDFHMCEIRMV